MEKKIIKVEHCKDSWEERKPISFALAYDIGQDGEDMVCEGDYKVVTNAVNRAKELLNNPEELYKETGFTMVHGIYVFAEVKRSLVDDCAWWAVDAIIDEAEDHYCDEYHYETDAGWRAQNGINELKADEKSWKDFENALKPIIEQWFDKYDIDTTEYVKWKYISVENIV